MKKLCLQPLFFLGLAIRLALIISVTPLAVSNWYVPFLHTSISSITLDPWSGWIAAGGTPVAFPYGYAMWLTFLPMTLAMKLIGAPMQYGYGLTLLAADFCLLLTLHRLLPGRQRLLLAVYWLSPIIILASYALGFNDLIPVLFLLLSILLIQRVELKVAGFLCAVAISAKLSMIIALPFFAIYLYKNKALQQRISQFLFGFLVCTLILGVPFLFSNDGLQMLLNNPEMGKIYTFIFSLGKNVFVYVVPLIYMILLYMVWQIRRLNFDLFQAIIGMAFLLIVLMAPTSPGWFIWNVPFLVLYQAVSGRIATLLIGLFSALYVVNTLLTTPILFSNGSAFDLSNVLPVMGQLGNYAVSLVRTAMVAIGIVLAIQIWRDTISGNNFFRLSRKPFVIGIAGDSGSGKDTFSDSIIGLFGGHSVVRLSGDDYHLWDRQKPIWQVMTHLNPMANDLEGFCNDLISLIDGKSIQSIHYNHQTGKRSKPFRIKSNDFIIASGLHALYLPILRECYNLKVYLDIDEGLRRYLKLERDVYQRGYSAEQVLSSFEKRALDSERFIRSQLTYADLILSLHPIHPRMLEDQDAKRTLRLKLIVRTRHGFNELSLHRVLIGVCGLHVDITADTVSDEIQMTIEGETSAADVALAAKMLCPHVLEFLDIPPKWQDGMAGLMQLITLSHINQTLTKRFI